jgi:ABC-type nitrate/sulfonate/bicarbonate transport system substrate-binding protein
MARRPIALRGEPVKHAFFRVVVLIVSCASVAHAADRLRIAYSSISGAYTGIWVAHDAGFFAREGLEDQIILIPSATQLAQVVVSGDVDIASLGGAPMIAAVLNGADLKIIGNNVNKLIFSLHVKPEIKSIEELRGKRIAVSRFGSSSDVAARHAVRKFNLDPLKDVTLLQLGSMSNMFGALKSGAVEASMVSPPTQFLSEKLGFKELLSVTDMDLAYPNPGMASPATSYGGSRILSIASCAPMCAPFTTRKITATRQSKLWRNTPPSRIPYFSPRLTTSI